jgi:chromosome segregation ATPase
MSTPTPPTDKSQLEAEIEQTRADLGQTVEALAAKTDVKARAQEKIATTKAEVKSRAQEKLADAGEKLSAAKAGAGEKLAAVKADAGEKLSAAKAGAGEKLAAAKDQTTQTTDTVRQRVAVASSGPTADTARRRFSTLQQRVAETSRRPAVRRAVPPAAVAIALIGATAVIVSRRRSR